MDTIGHVQDDRANTGGGISIPAVGGVPVHWSTSMAFDVLESLREN